MHVTLAGIGHGALIPIHTRIQGRALEIRRKCKEKHKLPQTVEPRRSSRLS